MQCERLLIHQKCVNDYYKKSPGGGLVELLLESDGEVMANKITITFYLAE